MTKVNKKWRQEHVDDYYVKQAQQHGYRSRAAYKLKEIDARDHILRPGLTVLDLGAAPGSWSQLARQKIGSKGHVIAQDLLPMEPIAGVDFIQGDLCTQDVYERLLQLLGSMSVDLVMSDMSPNISGVKTLDQPRAMHLCEISMEMALNVLVKGGDFLVKVFQGEGFDVYLHQLQSHFKKVTVRKPHASRARSSEVYLLARNYNNNQLGILIPQSV